MKLDKRDEQWADGSSAVAGTILVFPLLLLGAGAACLALGWSAPVGWALIGLAVVLFLIAG